MQNWWGTFTFSEFEARYWEIGQALLCLERHKGEWRIATQTLSEEKSTAKVYVPEISTVDKSKLTFKRFVFHRTDPTITLTPVMA